jgi:copper chaperone
VADRADAGCGTSRCYTPCGYTDAVNETAVYRVPGMSCGHCVQAVESELAAVPGVEGAEADLETKVVTVRGWALDDTALRSAIGAAGYEAE